MTLKELRLKHGYTQQKVAKEMNVSVATYRRYENDMHNIKKAPITRALALSGLYGVSIDCIVLDICNVFA